MASSHPYEGPSLTAILVLFGFLFLLNVVNTAFDTLLSCGLVGQIIVGMLFGTPGSKLLSSEVEATVSALGYLGLILMVYEGGLSTSLTGLVSCCILAVLVALTGILLPIALSFTLVSFGASLLQSFSAGASLSATSLGTTFATLSTSGLLGTHLGTVLTSAAMLDDVVSLIMLQVITELSGKHVAAADYGKVIGRTLGASVGFVALVTVMCRLVVRPLYTPLSQWTHSSRRPRVIQWIWKGPYTTLFLHTSLLLTLVVIGSLAGTSVLLAAFVAGVLVRWWGEVIGSGEAAGLHVYEQFYGSPTDPFYDLHSTNTGGQASIGFSIPITQMFRATIVWKGLVYAFLMFLGKLATGLWLVPGSLESPPRLWTKKSIASFWRRKHSLKCRPTDVSHRNGPQGGEMGLDENLKCLSSFNAAIIASDPDSSPGVASQSGSPDAETAPAGLENLSPVAQEFGHQNISNGSSFPSIHSNIPSPATSEVMSNELDPPGARQLPMQPPNFISSFQEHVDSHVSPTTATKGSEVCSQSRSLRAYSPVLVGLAMTVRGEVGFLIASLAESRGIFIVSPSTSKTSTNSAESEEGFNTTSALYLIVVWAIFLCTVTGPIAIGGILRIIKRLETQTRV